MNEEEKKRNRLKIDEPFKSEDASAELENLTSGSGNAVKPIAESDVTPRYFCTVRQFATFQKSTTDKQKARIVDDYVNPQKGKSFWHHMSEAAIKSSLKNGHDSKPIYNEMHRLRNIPPYAGEKEKNKEINRKLCIRDLEAYLKVQYPLAFRVLKRERIKLDKGGVKHFDYLGIRIKVTPDYVFRTTIDGKTYVGGVRLAMTERKKFKLLQHRIIAHFLRRFLEKQVARQDEEVLPEFCLCVDVYEGKVVAAPTGTDIPYKVIDETCREYAELYRKYGNKQ